MFKKILIPLDGSALSEKALPAALEVSNKFGAELILLRVVERPQAYLHADGWVDLELINSIEEQAKKAVARYLQEKEAELAIQGQIVTSMMWERQFPADAIIEAAEELDVELIVMSTHGHGGLTRWVFGSVADKVLRKAHVPVLLIRATEDLEDLELPALADELDLHEPA